jgi:hypothetical protein
LITGGSGSGSGERRWGGTGKTEITVTNADGKTATFKIICRVTQIGKQ